MLGDDALVYNFNDHTNLGPGSGLENKRKRLEFNFSSQRLPAFLGGLYNSGRSTDEIGRGPGPLPAVARVAAVWPIDMSTGPRHVNHAEASAQVARAGVQALFISQGPTLNSRRADITAMVARLRLPAMYGFREFADAGGLMSYGPNLPDMYRQSARLVRQDPKRRKPGRSADRASRAPATNLIVNLKAAKAIGFAISRLFLLLADEVIE